MTIIKGIYEEGKIILTEEPPVKKRTEVTVTFPDDKEEKKKPQKIILGLLQGKVDTPDDFNDPLDDLAEYM